MVVKWQQLERVQISLFVCPHDGVTAKEPCILAIVGLLVARLGLPAWIAANVAGQLLMPFNAKNGQFSNACVKRDIWIDLSAHRIRQSAALK